MGKLPTHHKVITHLYGPDIEAVIAQEKPNLVQGEPGWMAEYSQQFGKFNEMIKKNPNKNATIEKQWQQ